MINLTRRVVASTSNKDISIHQTQQTNKLLPTLFEVPPYSFQNESLSSEYQEAPRYSFLILFNYYYTHKLNGQATKRPDYTEKLENRDKVVNNSYQIIGKLIFYNSNKISNLNS